MTFQFFPATTWHRPRPRRRLEYYLTGRSHAAGPRSTNTKAVRKFQQLLFSLNFSLQRVHAGPSGTAESASVCRAAADGDAEGAGCGDGTQPLLLRHALPRGTVLCRGLTGERSHTHRWWRRGTSPLRLALSAEARQQGEGPVGGAYRQPGSTIRDSQEAPRILPESHISG